MSKTECVEEVEQAVKRIEQVMKIQEKRFQGRIEELQDANLELNQVIREQYQEIRQLRAMLMHEGIEFSEEF